MCVNLECTIERVIKRMQENLGDEYTIDDMARAARFSKFHFTRIFQRVTGVSPGRFLSFLRMERAEQLLVSTSLNVIDISQRVGYNSVGTFSSRFSSYVGVSPTTYRRLGGHLPEPAAEPDRDGEESTSIRGRVLAPPADRLGPVFVGLLRHPLPQGRPIRPTVLSAPGPYALRDVPPGTWYLLAYAMTTVGGEESTGPSPVTRRQYVGSHGPINVRPAAGDIVADVRLRPKRMLDPPVLTALPDLGARALSGRGGGPCHHGCSSAGRARRR